MNLSELGAAIATNGAETKALRERVDYLNVAVMRGDPRFVRPECAHPGFDCAAFDAAWQAKGKRVPSAEEVFGAPM